MEHTSIKNKSKRDTNLDFLRILSMIMVLLLHYFGKGQLLESKNVDEISYIIFYILESLAIVAVNCYVFISGYYLVKSEFKIRKFLKLWGEVVFYSTTIYIVMMMLGIEKFNITNTIKSCFPIITNQYWFITSYLAMYLLFPFLNKLIYAITEKEYRKLILIILLLFSVPSLFPSKWLLDKTGGYGIIWFVCLYLIIGYVRLYVSDDLINKYKNKYLLIYFLCGIIIATTMLLIQCVSNKVNIKINPEKLLLYNTPLVLIESLALFLYIKTINIKKENINKIILTIAPLTFSVYIIHEHPMIRAVLYKDILHTEICYHNPFAILIIITSILILFTVCITIEYAREKIVSLINKKIKYRKLTFTFRKDKK